MYWGFPGGTVVKNSLAKAGDTETQVRSLHGKDPLEKERVTHFSILDCEIPWTKQPGGLQCMGFQKSWTQLSD